MGGAARSGGLELRVRLGAQLFLLTALMLLGLRKEEICHEEEIRGMRYCGLNYVPPPHSSIEALTLSVTAFGSEAFKEVMMVT